MTIEIADKPHFSIEIVRDKTLPLREARSKEHEQFLKIKEAGLRRELGGQYKTKAIAQRLADAITNKTGIELPV